MKLSRKSLKITTNLCAIAALIFGAKLLEVNRELSTLKNDLYCYDTRFKFIGDESGEALEDVTMNGPSSSSEDIMQQSVTYTAYSGTELGASGLAYEPRKFSFSCPDYQTQEFVVDSDSDSSVTIRLKKLP